MSEELNFFAKIDQFIFKKIDIIKEDLLFQKLSELLSGLSDSQQKVIGQVLAFGIIILPTFFLFFFWWGNIKLKDSLEIKKQILEQIALLDGNKNTLNDMTSHFPSAVSSSRELETKIKQIASSQSISQETIFINEFLENETTTFSITTATVKFKGLGISEFSNLMRALIESGEFKLKSIDISKDNETNLLNGDIGIGHIGRKMISQDFE